MSLYSGKRIADMTTEEIQEEIRRLRQMRTIASSASRRATAEKRRNRAAREPNLSALADLPPELRDEVLRALGALPSEGAVGGDTAAPTAETPPEGEGILV